MPEIDGPPMMADDDRGRPINHGGRQGRCHRVGADREDHCNHGAGGRGVDPRLGLQGRGWGSELGSFLHPSLKERRVAHFPVFSCT